jgi:uncharacterized repeat protein (TIGR01451 family)
MKSTWMDCRRSVPSPRRACWTLALCGLVCIGSRVAWAQDMAPLPPPVLPGTHMAAIVAGQSGEPLPYAPRGTWAPPGIAQPWPKGEYLRDGGDKGLPAAVKPDWQVQGLEMEDTIAHFDTVDGRTLVTPSNEVQIYAPRFGAVRQVLGVVENETTNRLGGIHNPTRITQHDETRIVATDKQNLQAGKQTGTKHATTFRSKQGDGVVSNTVKLQGFRNAFKAYEDLAVVRYGMMLEAEGAVLAKGVTNAIAWEHKQAIQIVLDRQSALVDVSNQRLETVYTVKSPPANPKLRVVKVASTSFADPGDTVAFTIRFDNIGNQPIGNVTVIDNLTTRLEYVPNSTQCSVAAKFSAQPNEGGSEVLRWEITDPLPVGRGGVIRFDCRVR